MLSPAPTWGPVGTRLSPPATGVERGHQPFRRGLHTASPSAPQGILGPWPGRGAGQMPQGHVTTASRPGSLAPRPLGPSLPPERARRPVLTPQGRRSHRSVDQNGVGCVGRSAGLSGPGRTDTARRGGLLHTPAP